MLLFWPRRIPGGYAVVNSVSDVDPGRIVQRFPGWAPAAFVCAAIWRWQHQHDKEYQP